MNKNEDLNKSIDTLLDDLFSDESVEATSEEVIEKSKNAIDDIVGAPKQNKKDIQEDPEDLADDAVKKAPKSKDDKRPIKEVSDVPKTDKDGSRAKGYDAVQSSSSASDVANEKKTIAKSEDEVTVSKEDFEFLQKAKADRETEVLEKAKTEQEDLIKAIVETQTSDLKKALEDSTSLVKSLSDENEALKSKPRVQKSITSIKELETLEKGNNNVRTSFSKDEMLDAAEGLAKSGAIKIEQVIELENNGTIFDVEARKLIENELRKN